MAIHTSEANPALAELRTTGLNGTLKTLWHHTIFLSEQMIKGELCINLLLKQMNES